MSPTRPAALVGEGGPTGQRLVCPACGNNGEPGSCRLPVEQRLRVAVARFYWVEDQAVVRRVGTIDDGTLYVGSDAQPVDEGKPGTNRRLWCMSCGAELDLPQGLDWDFYL